jgi:hypothetical protein
MELSDRIDTRIEGWFKRDVAHIPNERVEFHFHEVEEWLEVLEGDATFYSAGGRPFRVSKGKVLGIPQGEVHRVEIGPEGMWYRMWLPVAVSPQAFSIQLGDKDMEVISAHLDLPTLENQRDEGRKNPNATPTSRALIAEVLLDQFMSKRLSFRDARGQTHDKWQYLNRRPSDGSREPARDRSVCVLHKCPSCLLLSTIVDVRQRQESSPSGSYMNLRLLGDEEDAWKCVTWMNFEI